MADDALTVFGTFLDLLRAQSSAWQDGSLIPDRSTDPAAWKLRLRAEQTNILQTAFTQAREEIAHRQ